MWFHVNSKHVISWSRPIHNQTFHFWPSNVGRRVACSIDTQKKTQQQQRLRFWFHRGTLYRYQFKTRTKQSLTYSVLFISSSTWCRLTKPMRRKSTGLKMLLNDWFPCLSVKMYFQFCNFSPVDLWEDYPIIPLWTTVQPTANLVPRVFSLFNMAAAREPWHTADHVPPTRMEMYSKWRLRRKGWEELGTRCFYEKKSLPADTAEVPLNVPGQEEILKSLKQELCKFHYLYYNNH